MLSPVENAAARAFASKAQLDASGVNLGVDVHWCVLPASGLKAAALRFVSELDQATTF